MPNLKPKMVVFETPKSDRILEGTDITKRQLQNIFIECFLNGEGKMKNPMKNFQEKFTEKTGKLISYGEAQTLANVVIHFGTKAIFGSSKAQLDQHVLTFDVISKKKVKGEG